MESVEAYRERIDTLTRRKADVEAQRDKLLRERADAIRAGEDTGDTWMRIQGCEQELHGLARELSDLGNFASDAFAAERLRTDRAEFKAANRSLSGKRGQLYRMRDEAIAAVNAAADKLKTYVDELDAMERRQQGRAVELNRLAETLGAPADFALPVERAVYTGEPYRRADAKTAAESRLLMMARKPDRRDFLVALAEAAFTHTGVS